MGSTLANDPRIEQYLENTNIVVSSSALPTGASTSANQTNGNQVTKANIQVGGNAVTTSNPVPVCPPLSGALPISATSLPLPTGASTSANQTTANNSLSSIDTKLSSQSTATNQSTMIANQTNGTQKTKLISGTGEGHTAMIDHFHNLQTSEQVRLVGTSFVGTTKDTNFWVESGASGTGAVSQSGGICTLTTGSTANSAIVLSSVRSARFIPATTNVCRFVGYLSDGATNNVRQWGMYNSADGLFFRLSGTTLSIVTRIGSADATPITVANFNVANTFVMDANIHSWEIRASYKTADFYIDDILVHSMDVYGGASFKYGTLTLPIVMSNVNSGGGSTVCTMNFILATIFRVGKLQTAPQYRNITGVNSSTILKYGPGMLHRIILGTPTNNGTVSVYDNVSGTGTPICVITCPATAGQSLSYDIGIGFGTGLNIVPSAVGLNITVVYE